ncbi:YcaO-like family protein [Streptomyces sp. NPDC052101]|uniref:YcaO-like family protein n=1 Tax=Streptomyces sp. NPDC052101 TaxID=3155763 RepID=UPI0034458025
MTSITLTGTVRARTPEETWDALKPHIARLGISRVARLTGLDHLGIPVWTAVRPAAHTLVTSQGKGATDTLAKISAVLESAELWHAEQPLKADIRATHRDLDLPYPMHALPVKIDHHSLEDVPLDWVTGHGLVTGEPVLIPADVVRRRVHPIAAEPEVFHVTSNGLACGNTLPEATLHALLETVERDVLHDDYVSGSRFRTLVEPATVTDPYCRDLVGRFLDAGMWLEIAWVDNAYGVPVCAAYIWSEDYPVTFAGSGCHFAPQIALSRALTEAAQSRLTCIAGTRDDLDIHENAFAADPERPAPADLPVGNWNNLIHHLEPDDDLGLNLAAIAAGVAATVGHEPIAFPLHNSPAYAAVKVVSPGLEMRIIRSIPRPGSRRG